MGGLLYSFVSWLRKPRKLKRKLSSSSQTSMSSSTSSETSTTSSRNSTLESLLKLPLKTFPSLPPLPSPPSSPNSTSWEHELSGVKIYDVGEWDNLKEREFEDDGLYEIIEVRPFPPPPHHCTYVHL